MTLKANHYLLTFLFTVITIFYAKSQIAISNTSELAKIKGGTTYIAMKDPSTEKAKKFIEVFKNNWTISKFEFIKYSEIEDYLSPNSSFLTIGGYETNVQFIKLYQNGRSKNGINYSNTHLYLELWTCADNYFENKKDKKSFENKDKIQVARIELFTDFETLADPDKIFQSDYDGDGHIRNWRPGILKNYLQSLMNYLNKSKNRTLFSETINEKEIKNLKNEILYVPEYVLMKFNKFTGDETKKHNEKSIFKDYKFKYQLLSKDELSEKILVDNTPFYYLIYIKSSTDKYINVINSTTGEIIYSKYSPVSYNIKSKDLKKLQKQVQQ
ncbi:hypothetical protein [Aurantibacter aestuarii]|uniref:Uncharacterized protein n=1 Tax=Aurantibacter aestuarii TaxID=1266046 RepID=A0A2T1N8Q5_9FLAO|nr:hypothetical protein [Aurantibacter aestuarii]PSG88260.1 hypothetical protein C7H52_08110 [Aurantibacter aestuarii]